MPLAGLLYHLFFFHFFDYPLHFFGELFQLLTCLFIVYFFQVLFGLLDFLFDLLGFFGQDFQLVLLVGVVGIFAQVIQQGPQLVNAVVVSAFFDFSTFMFENMLPTVCLALEMTSFPMACSSSVPKIWV